MQGGEDLALGGLVEDPATRVVTDFSRSEATPVQ